MDILNLRSKSHMFYLDIEELDKVDPLIGQILIPSMFVFQIVVIVLIIFEHTLIYKKAMIHTNLKMIIIIYCIFTLQFNIGQLINMGRVLFFKYDKVFCFIVDNISESGSLAMVFIGLPMFVERYDAYRNSQNYESSSTNIKYIPYCILCSLISTFIILNQTLRSVKITFLELINETFTTSIWLLSSIITAIGFTILYKKNQKALEKQKVIKNNLLKRFQLEEICESIRALSLTIPILSLASIILYAIHIICEMRLLTRSIFAEAQLFMISLITVICPLCVIILLPSTNKALREILRIKKKVPKLEVINFLKEPKIVRLHFETELHFNHTIKLWN
uniref:G_PROTEIN_RECEP_F1_2 domain-containing protein n=1 Tax=Rhabditophanes sp. KR3021 TaxID=114890 RepID=A0AC35TLX2_9BILA